MNPLHLILILLTVAIWGFNFVAIKVGLQEMPPLLLCCVRFFLTSLPAILFVKFPKTSFGCVALYGLTTFALQFTLLFMGMRAGVSAGLTSLLLQTQVFFTILLAVLFLGERVKLWQIIGALISFSGIALIGINLSGTITLMGLALILSAAFCWGSGTVIAKKIGRVNMLSLVVWGGCIAWPPLLMISCLMEGSELVFHTLQNLSWLSIVSSGYIAYLSTIFAFGVWNWLVSRYPLSMLTPFTFLVPLFGIGSSALFLGEAIESWKIYAGILIIGGLSVNLLLGSRSLQNASLVEKIE